MSRVSGRALIPGLVAAGIITGGVMLKPSQPESVRLHSQPSERRPIDGPKYAAWVPPGTYTAIVLNSSGDQRRWAVSLMTRTMNVPIVVPAGDNIVIEFKEGWRVDKDDEARLVSNLVPFDDSSLYNKVGEEPKYVLSAWGITQGGPVEFVYRALEK